MAEKTDLTEARSLVRAGKLAEAESACHAALAVNLADTEAWRLIAALTRQRGDAIFAEAAIRRALAIEPGYGPGLVMLADLLRERRAFGEALPILRRALDLDNANPEAWHCLGLVHQADGDLDATLACFERAIQLAPNFVAALINLGSLKMGREKYPEALHCYDRALALAPDHAVAHWNRALALLTSGDYRRAWPDYEWRWRIPQLVRNAEVRIFERRWRGEDCAGRTLLLQSEQGLGDTLQFARFAPMVAERGARVVLMVQPQLVPVLAQLPGVAQAIAITDPIPQFDVQASLLDLPGILGVTPDGIPGTLGYLRSDAALTAGWRSRLAYETRPKIGLVWAGSPRHPDDRNRSLPATSLDPLTEDRRFAWFSLQLGDRARDLAIAGIAGRITDLAPSLGSFADSAAALSALDLLICVDTAPAHLAGALGVPAFVVLPRQADWRWLRGRADSPWYASLTLFRQKTQGDWLPVIDEVRRALDFRFFALDRTRQAGRINRNAQAEGA